MTAKRSTWPVACHWCGVKGSVSREQEPGPAFRWECADCRDTQRTIYGDPKHDHAAAVGAHASRRHAEWSRLMGYSMNEGGANQGNNGDD